MAPERPVASEHGGCGYVSLLQHVLVLDLVLIIMSAGVRWCMSIVWCPCKSVASDYQAQLRESLVHSVVPQTTQHYLCEHQRRSCEPYLNGDDNLLVLRSIFSLRYQQTHQCC